MRNFLITLFGLKSQPEQKSPHIGNCPINEQTGDGVMVGRCWFSLNEKYHCPRHGDVSEELKHFNETGELTLENKQRERNGKPLLG